MRSLARRLKQGMIRLRTAWSILGVTMALLVLAELGLRAAFCLKDRVTLPERPDRRVVAAGYVGATWPVVHYRELEALSDRWEPYVYFRQRPFQGQTITIDENGLRAVWQPQVPSGWSREDQAPLKVLMLGGSSLWGFGSRDEFTIPSLIARKLHEQGLRVDVKNLAEIGYVSTQELIGLTRELQQGYRPDLVLFYDGVNDTTSALLEGKPMLTTNEINRVREFNLLQSPGRLTTALVGNLVKNSGFFRVARSIGLRLWRGPETAYPALAQEDSRKLAERVVDGYLGNVKLAHALGKQYGFQPLFVWQPVIFAKPKLVPFEQEEAARYGWARPLFLLVQDRIRQTPGLTSDPAFLDLSGAFADSEELEFIDFCHTTERAGARIAAVLASKLRELKPRSEKSPKPGK
jgi:lysophospholipase L1-like esterase